MLNEFLINLKGKLVRKKIIVFESDDWGSLRMPDLKTYHKLLRYNIPVDKSFYCRYDSLESDSDIDDLINVLKSIKNVNGQNPVITANFVSANPDFNKIKDSNFEKYYCESIDLTYKKFYNSSNVIEKIKKSSVIIPEFHGRDHVNVPLWLYLLKNNKYYKIAFEYNVWGLSNDVFPQMKISIQSTYDSNDKNYVIDSLSEGLFKFNNVFNRKASSFIANNYIWPNYIYDVLRKNGIINIQSMKYQLLPFNNQIKKRQKIRRKAGEIVYSDIFFNIRNCQFEPILTSDSVNKTLNQIHQAFIFKKPAVISTHRINFVSRLDKKIRDINLKKFEILLKEIIKKWPDVSFFTSSQLNQEYI